MKEIKVPVLPESITRQRLPHGIRNQVTMLSLMMLLSKLRRIKSFLEVPAEESGVLTEILAEEGETVSEQQVLGLIDDEAVLQKMTILRD